jgi:hypothetical protein
VRRSLTRSAFPGGAWERVNKRGCDTCDSPGRSKRSSPGRPLDTWATTWQVAPSSDDRATPRRPSPAAGRGVKKIKMATTESGERIDENFALLWKNLRKVHGGKKGTQLFVFIPRWRFGLVFPAAAGSVNTDGKARRSLGRSAFPGRAWERCQRKRHPSTASYLGGLDSLGRRVEWSSFVAFLFFATALSKNRNLKKLLATDRNTRCRIEGRGPIQTRYNSAHPRSCPDSTRGFGTIMARQPCRD